MPVVRKDAFAYFFNPTRTEMVADATPQESAKLEEHFNYLKKLTDGGAAVLVGRVTEPPYTGLVVFYAGNRKEAEAVVAQDPAVAAGLFAGTVSPFRIVMLA